VNGHPHSRISLVARAEVGRVMLKQFDRFGARPESASLDRAPDVEALDHCLAVSIAEHSELPARAHRSLLGRASSSHDLPATRLGEAGKKPERP